MDDDSIMQEVSIR